MSSLWTPQGEHRVPRERGAADGPAAGGGGDSAGGTGGDAGDHGDRPPAARGGDDAGPSDDFPEEELLTDEEQLAHLAELRAQILAAPAEDVVANHAFGLFELAAIHLSAERPAMPAARLAIDALAALVEGLGDRLGRNAGALRDGLSQIQLAFVNIAQAAPASDGDNGDPSGGVAG